MNDLANLTSEEITRAGIADQFDRACIALGKRINSAHNAELVWQAHQAYLQLYPETARGKGNSKEKDPEVKSFRLMAAEKAGVPLQTIDILLPIGRMWATMDPDLKESFRKTKGGRTQNLLRAVASPSLPEEKRTKLLSDYVAQTLTYSELQEALKPAKKDPSDKKLVDKLNKQSSPKPQTGKRISLTDFPFPSEMDQARERDREALPGLMENEIKGILQQMVKPKNLEAHDSPPARLGECIIMQMFLNLWGCFCVNLSTEGNGKIVLTKRFGIANSEAEALELFKVYDNPKENAA
jgi:hypothetical protein